VGGGGANIHFLEKFTQLTSTFSKNFQEIVGLIHKLPLHQNQVFSQILGKEITPTRDLNIRTMFLVQSCVSPNKKKWEDNLKSTHLELNYCSFLICKYGVTMSLRRFLAASSLILAPIATIGFQSAAFAGTDSTNIIIGGTVAPVIDIEATATSDAAQLPLSTAGQQTLKIADLTLNSNNYGGVTVTVTSTNNGQLVDSGNPENAVLYQIDVVGDGGTPDNFRFLNAFSQSVTAPNTDLYIRFTNLSVPKQGTYNDTITITVADN
jgi:hypothetical protein